MLQDLITIQIGRECCLSFLKYEHIKAIFTGYFKVSVNFNIESWMEKFIIPINILYPIYSILIRSENILCILYELLMSFIYIYLFIYKNH